MAWKVYNFKKGANFVQHNHLLEILNHYALYFLKTVNYLALKLASS